MHLWRTPPRSRQLVPPCPPPCRRHSPCGRQEACQQQASVRNRPKNKQAISQTRHLPEVQCKERLMGLRRRVLAECLRVSLAIDFHRQRSVAHRRHTSGITRNLSEKPWKSQATAGWLCVLPLHHHVKPAVRTVGRDVSRRVPELLSKDKIFAGEPVPVLRELSSLVGNLTGVGHPLWSQARLSEVFLRGSHATDCVCAYRRAHPRELREHAGRHRVMELAEDEA